MPPRDSLAPEQASAVESLAATAEAADGVAPLSEATLLGLRRPGTEHRLLTQDERVVAYAGTQDDGSAELVVHPSHRRAGLGRRLLDEVLAATPDAKVWAHGDLPGAQALARATGLDVVRELWRMSLDTEAHPPTPAALPDGFVARSFVPGQDDEAWLRVNAAAFVDHPEQGRMTQADLDDRKAQPWFDAAGLVLVEDVTGETPVLAASHWTKVEDAGSCEGEVYVVAVAPTHQGRGLGRAVTWLGLEHLLDVGVRTVHLYVEGDNAPAIATYRGQGFTRSAHDVMYARTAPDQVGT